MKLEQAIQEYGALLDGQYLGVYKIAQMAKTFRQAARRSKFADDKMTYYTCYRNCDQLVNFCIEQEMPFATIDI